jgi:hypothetical protein
MFAILDAASVIKPLSVLIVNDMLDLSFPAYTIDLEGVDHHSLRNFVEN